MGICALLAYKGTLPHSKAMLFVGNAQTETVEFYIIADKGVGADYNINFAIFKTGKDITFFLCLVLLVSKATVILNFSKN